MLTKRLTTYLWILCVIGSWGVLPYIYRAGVIPSSTSAFYLFLMSTLQAIVIYGIVCWLSYLLLRKTDLRPFEVSNLSKQVIYPGCLYGIVVGLIIFFLEKTLFSSSALAKMHPPFWAGILASIYGGINEEVFMRLFLVTLIYFLLKKIFKRRGALKSYLLWTSIIIVAIIFAAGHLPMAFKIASPSFLEIVRILLLNAFPGIIFGWLYCSKGFWTAATAHFTTDIMIHALLI